MVMTSLFYRTASLEPLASYALSKNVSLHILGGSIVDYSPGAFRGALNTSPEEENTEEKEEANKAPTRLAAIVNAANEGCLGGGGVDGAIGAAGGLNLDRDRRALRQIPNPAGGPHVRCPTGQAVATGPGEYGRLKVPFVIHAVGPIYNQWNVFSMGNEEEEEGDLYAQPNVLLHNAYKSALQVAHENDIVEIAFSLLSAGVFRGQQKLDKVMSIAIEAIQEFVKNNDEEEPIVQDISLVAFSVREKSLLVQVSKSLLGASEEEKEDATETEEKDETKENEKNDDSTESVEKDTTEETAKQNVEKKDSKASAEKDTTAEIDKEL